MTRPPFSVIIEPALQEEAVLRAIVGRPEERAFRQARDRLYVVAADERDRGFAELHRQWFEQLGLGQAIQTALAELPALVRGSARCLVTSAPTHRDEGADLLVASDATGADARTVVIRLCRSSFEDPSGLLLLLRAELLHVADMLDPAFGYEPRLPQADAGPSYESLLRDRYRALWDVSVTGRLARRGVAPSNAQEEAARAFAAAFPMLGAATYDEFARFFTGAACTHAEFIAFAAEPRGHKSAPGLAVGGRCPLCRFPTYAPELYPEELPADVIECIASDFPAWQPTDGLCGQCADIYRARRLSVAAAAALPGYGT